MKEFTSTLSQGTHVRLKSREFYCLPCITYSSLSSGDFGCRVSEAGFLFDTKGSCIFGKQDDLKVYSGLLNSCPAKLFLKILCPTLDYSMVGIKQVPVNENKKFVILDIVEKCLRLSRTDWDSYETSWDFTILLLLRPDYRQPTLNATYQKLRTNLAEMTLEMQRLEEENNRIFIDAYGLQDELTPDVPLEEITLTCNPYYRYGKKVESVKQEVGSDGEKTFPFDQELEDRLLADTMKEFISYAVDCMFGRYSLDKPGLILANQGEGVADYVRKVESEKWEVGSNPETSPSSHSPLSTSHCPTTSTSHCTEISFEPDADNVIPILGDNWFTDDIVERFQCFLKVTFGEERYEENLRFIENAIGKSLRKYFLKVFYPDHVKRYKKRPIYWLFSSPKGNFNALIYMHRYRPDTVSVILNDYLREFRTKLVAKREHLEKVSISATAGNREKTAALKEIDKLTKTIDELNTYENDILYPLATQNIEIDLDDGVKANYPKFGQALKKIPGLG